MLENIYISAKCGVLAFYTDFCSSIVNKTKFFIKEYISFLLYMNISFYFKEKRDTHK